MPSGERGGRPAVASASGGVATPPNSSPRRGRSASFTTSAWWRPSRITASRATVPGGRAAISRISSSFESTGCPSTSTTTSYGRRPARSAGELTLTSWTTAPRATVSPSARCKAGVTSVRVTPMKPRDTRPALFNCGSTATAWLIGTAKPMLLVRELTAALMPTTSPRVLISGPPLLPKLIAASVWM